MKNLNRNILMISSQLETGGTIPRKKLIKDKINRMRNDQKIFEQFGSFLK